MSDSIFMDVRQAKDFVANAGSATNVFKSSVVSSILTAMGAGKKNVGISLSGQAASDIREVLGGMNRLGYSAQIVSGNSMSISWS